MLEKIEIDQVIKLAKKAGDAIMEVYGKDFDVEFKGHQSPLTEADKKAHNVIEKGLNKISEDLNIVIPILSEEGKEINYSERKDWNYYWLVDPLDGTKEFVKKNGEFTVNIALIHNSEPVLGVVYAPALDVTYSAKQGAGAFKDGIKLPIKTESHRETYKIVASRSHMSEETQKFIDEISTDKKKELISIGSSLKICLVAEGEADVYPRLGPTMEWDTGAAHAIVNESGMQLRKYDDNGFSKFTYNKENLLNSWFIVSATL